MAFRSLACIKDKTVQETLTKNGGKTTRKDVKGVKFVALTHHLLLAPLLNLKFPILVMGRLSTYFLIKSGK